VQRDNGLELDRTSLIGSKAGLHDADNC